MWTLLLLGLLARPPAPEEAAATASPRLVAAATRGDAAGVAALLRAGADPDSADRAGWTALHQAAEAGDVDMARRLLDGGATPDLRSRDRGTALDVAEREGRTELARLLRSRGARGSGKSIGDTVCVRPWRGDGYCGVVEAVAGPRFRLRVSRVVGCRDGCMSDPLCSGARPVGGADGLGAEDRLWVPASCLTHTGVR